MKADRILSVLKGRDNGEGCADSFKSNSMPLKYAHKCKTFGQSQGFWLNKNEKKGSLDESTICSLRASQHQPSKIPYISGAA